LIYEVRDISRGAKIPLRDEDLDVLAALVGDEPADVEERLIELMGCSRDEARSLCSLLMRRRVLATAAGLLLSLSFVGTLGDIGGASRAPSRAPHRHLPRDPRPC
jgi:hypothetical protein